MHCLCAGVAPPTSQYAGVSWDQDRQRWQARGRRGSKHIRIAKWVSEKEAAAQYDAWLLQKAWPEPVPQEQLNFTPAEREEVLAAADAAAMQPLQELVQAMQLLCSSKTPLSSMDASRLRHELSAMRGLARSALPLMQALQGHKLALAAALRQQRNEAASAEQDRQVQLQQLHELELYSTAQQALQQHGLPQLLARISRAALEGHLRGDHILGQWLDNMMLNLVRPEAAGYRWQPDVKRFWSLVESCQSGAGALRQMRGPTAQLVDTERLVGRATDLGSTAGSTAGSSSSSSSSSSRSEINLLLPSEWALRSQRKADLPDAGWRDGYSAANAQQFAADCSTASGCDSSGPFPSALQGDESDIRVSQRSMQWQQKAGGYVFTNEATLHGEWHPAGCCA